ncbi:mitochondrial 2-oxodicarboxylate carrier isoform X3 [Physeter macrocephalus]|uniref:Mitochondrial 2-oxodicarboxylate carrier n=1 Tax=Physeter macrocephalus TaxID=9755 RepID=A0A455BRD3_PHYMC|nr:mitochondrial 2-oxodicarboxylate carrier isoform X3 [Physeter catodon]XP_028351536.1 mitochondrial 2-oxodicarboxylate carrier isoform X3 [Physeter catodon]|eukprot:XP_028351535.1 mitochondrial 2-oxodicarboxylate carrier isoform X3 [Physeter catodon]
MSAKPAVGFVNEASRQILAGGSAGLVEICLMHPLDVVKTRFQIQRCATDPNSYKSLGDSFRMIFRTEGLFGFYKGILPPILAETPKRAVKFFTFEQYKKLLGYVSLSPELTFAIAGLGSGLTEAIVVNPFEVVKVGLQANRNKFTEQPSTMSYARHIIKKEGLGLQGLNKGFTATLGRHGVFNMVYFGFYYNVKNIIPVNKLTFQQGRWIHTKINQTQREPEQGQRSRIRQCFRSAQEGEINFDGDPRKSLGQGGI